MAVVLAVGGTLTFVATGQTGLWLSEFGGSLSGLAISSAVIVWLVIRRRPRNAAVWTMAATAFFGGIYLAGWAVAAMIEYPNTVAISSVTPADLSLPAARILMATAPVVVGFLAAPVTFGLLLFPDGKLPSRRWRWVAVLACTGIALAWVAMAWGYRPSNAEPVTHARSEWLGNLGWVLMIIASLLSLAALAGRFRRSKGDARDQFKWIVFGYSIFLTGIIVGFFFGDTHVDLVNAIFTAAVIVFLASYGIAVGRYRLYDINVVISRTLVFGTLAVFISGVYVIVVVGVGRLFGHGSEPNRGLEIAATAAIAVMVQPLRRRLQWTANRIVYGKKATPYQVLSEFNRRVAATGDELLEQVARSLVEGTGARSAGVWVVIDREMAKAAEWPEGADLDMEVSDWFPIKQDGLELGRLTLASPPGQHLDEQDRRLATEVASGMGLALRNRRLTGALESRVEELRISRRRLVAVQDEVRRKLERDLHDGAQQQLVALKVKLGLSRAIAEKEGGLETARLLQRLSGEADGAVDALRNFARGVYPPLLEAEGLSPALRAQALRSPLPVDMETDGIGRYDRDVEATVYFCVVEALQNIAKYAEATRATIDLCQLDGSVRFQVNDNGRGFDPASTLPGGGLTNIADRLEAVNGSLAIDSSPGHGTTVSGLIPLEVDR